MQVPSQHGNNDISSYARRMRIWNDAILNLGICASAASRKFVIKKRETSVRFALNRYFASLVRALQKKKAICVKQSLVIHETFQHGKLNFINLTNICHEIITCVLLCISKIPCWYRLTNLRVNALLICDASQLVPVLLSIWSFWSSSARH